MGVTLIVAFGTAGCGGGPPSDRTQVITAVRAFAAAGMRPSARLCDLLSRRFIEQSTRLRGPAAASRCRVRAAAAGAPPASAETLPFVKLESVRLRGREASVEATAPGQPTSVVHLVKEQDAWKIDTVASR
jgi:hypothetical protein